MLSHTHKHQWWMCLRWNYVNFIAKEKAREEQPTLYSFVCLCVAMVLRFFASPRFISIQPLLLGHSHSHTSGRSFFTRSKFLAVPYLARHFYVTARAITAIRPLTTRNHQRQHVDANLSNGRVFPKISVHNYTSNMKICKSILPSMEFRLAVFTRSSQFALGGRAHCTRNIEKAELPAINNFPTHFSSAFRMSFLLHTDGESDGEKRTSSRTPVPTQLQTENQRKRNKKRFYFSFNGLIYEYAFNSILNPLIFCHVERWLLLLSSIW